MTTYINYLIGGIIGMLNGLLAAALAQNGKGGRSEKSTYRLMMISAILGLLFSLYEVWLFEGLNSDFWGLLILSGALLSASITDITRKEILLFPMTVYIVLIAIYHIAALNIPLFINAALGAGVGSLIFGIPRLIRPGSIGRGDVLLLAVCGFGAGFPGVIYILLRSLIALAAVSVIQLLRKKATAQSEMPLAPFLLFGVLI